MNIYSQDQDFIPDRAEAARAFESEDFSTAFKHYKALTDNFTADPVYKYFTGACMVEMKMDPDKSKRLLKEAISNSSSIRTVPEKAWYYLGRAYQQAGDFDLAIDAYDKFRDSVRRKESDELGIEELISQCYNGIGEINIEDEPELKDNTGIPALTKQDDLVEPVDSIGDNIAAADTNTPEAHSWQEPPGEYSSLAREALENQFMADSLMRLANRYRETLSQVSESDRESVRARILSLEQKGFEYQKIADSKYREAAQIASVEYDGRQIPEAVKIDDEPAEPGEKTDDTTTVVRDTVNTAVEIVAPKPYVPVLQIFSDDYDQAGEIPVNPELPEGLIYRIQLAAFRNPKDLDFFKGLGPVSIYREEGSDINFYYAGIFRSKKDAERALLKVKQKGFNDAFILALMDGTRVSMEKAEQYESEWSGKSLYDKDSVTATAREPAEPPTLVYRVQVYKVQKKLEDDELELLERLADKRSYDIYQTAGKEYVYLIGKFLTFESAAAYADLLYRNGMKEAEVVAYLGDKEIPLETAKRLFEIYFDK